MPQIQCSSRSLPQWLDSTSELGLFLYLCICVFVSNTKMYCRSRLPPTTAGTHSLIGSKSCIYFFVLIFLYLDVYFYIKKKCDAVASCLPRWLEPTPELAQFIFRPMSRFCAHYQSTPLLSFHTCFQ